MSSDIEILRRLHRILRQQADIRSQLVRGPRTVQVAKNVWDFAAKGLAAHREDVKKKRMDADRIQLQLRTREAKIFELEGKMNMAKGNREYQMLKDQIAADQQANLVLSDEILETLEGIDKLLGLTHGFEERVQLTESEAKKIEAATETRKASLESDLERITGDLVATEALLKGELKNTYRRLVQLRAEDALAPLDGKACGGCNTSLSPRILDRLRMNEPMVCTSCACLIYPPE
ncbi:MAG: phospholipase [Pirellulaceae bacterium]|nr:phospholipase [Pirellulaceae bacterium]